MTGFFLSGRDMPTVYVSGDNASLDVVRTIAERVGPVDLALLNAGAAQSPLVPGGFLTLTGAGAAEAVRVLGSPESVPLHFDGWAHFTQGRETLAPAFERVGLAERPHLLAPGQAIEL